MKKTNFLFPALLIFACSTGDKSITGTLTESDTSAMVGLVYDRTLSPVMDAAVTLHRADSSPGIFIGTNPGGNGSGSNVTATDKNGFFLFDSLDTGTFFVEIAAGDTLGSLSRVNIMPDDTMVSMTAYLKKLGGITGTVGSALSNQDNAYVHVVEINRNAQVSYDGSFTIPDLPVWQSYTLELFVMNSPVSSEFDNMAIRVAEDSMTVIINTTQNIMQMDSEP